MPVKIVDQCRQSLVQQRQDLATSREVGAVPIEVGERCGDAAGSGLNNPACQQELGHDGLVAEVSVGECLGVILAGDIGCKSDSGNAEHASTERIWDIILTKSLAEFDLPVMYGLATDDGHNYHGIPSRKSEPGRGWVMVLAEALGPESIIPALERGDFYSTSGVMLDKVTSSSEGLSVEIRAEPGVDYRIEFIGTEAGYDKSSQPVLDKKGKEVLATRRYSKDIGQVFATHDGPSASYRFRGKEIYVRARITSSRKHANPPELNDFEQSWVQPVVGPAARSQSE